MASAVLVSVVKSKKDFKCRYVRLVVLKKRRRVTTFDFERRRQGKLLAELLTSVCVFDDTSVFHKGFVSAVTLSIAGNL